jgi:hypothetical protein
MPLVVGLLEHYADAVSPSIQRATGDVDEIDDGQQNEHGYPSNERVTVVAGTPIPIAIEIAKKTRPVLVSLSSGSFSLAEAGII